MAEIIINKGFIACEGIIYGAGEVVDIADNDEAKRLVENSGGDFSFHHGDNVPESGTNEAPAEEEEAADADVPESGTEEEAAEPGEGLPALDPNAAVQTTKTKTRTSKGKK